MSDDNDDDCQPYVQTMEEETGQAVNDDLGRPQQTPPNNLMTASNSLALNTPRLPLQLQRINANPSVGIPFRPVSQPRNTSLHNSAQVANTPNAPHNPLMTASRVITFKPITPRPTVGCTINTTTFTTTPTTAPTTAVVTTITNPLTGQMAPAGVLRHVNTKPIMIQKNFVRPLKTLAQPNAPQVIPFQPITSQSILINNNINNNNNNDASAAAVVVNSAAAMAIHANTPQTVPLPFQVIPYKPIAANPLQKNPLPQQSTKVNAATTVVPSSFSSSSHVQAYKPRNITPAPMTHRTVSRPVNTVKQAASIKSTRTNQTVASILRSEGGGGGGGGIVDDDGGNSHGGGAGGDGSIAGGEGGNGVNPANTTGLPRANTTIRVLDDLDSDEEKTIKEQIESLDAELRLLNSEIVAVTYQKEAVQREYETKRGISSHIANDKEIGHVIDVGELNDSQLFIALNMVQRAEGGVKATGVNSSYPDVRDSSSMRLFAHDLRDISVSIYDMVRETLCIPLNEDIGPRVSKSRCKPDGIVLPKRSNATPRFQGDDIPMTRERMKELILVSDIITVKTFPLDSKKKKKVKIDVTEQKQTTSTSLSTSTDNTLTKLQTTEKSRIDIDLDEEVTDSASD